MKKLFKIQLIFNLIFFSYSIIFATPWADVFEQAKDKVVQIFAYESKFDWQEPPKRGDIEMMRGTGFILDGTNKIYTNFHVIDGADVIHIQVPALGKKRFKVTFKGGSPDYDWACLELTPESEAEICAEIMQLKELGLIESTVIRGFQLGESDGLKQGEEIMLISYPMGEENVTSTVGIITGQQMTPWGECLTTNAASNPGSSGGPVIDIHGTIVGILVGSWQGTQGIHYVLPITPLKVILDELKDGIVLESPFWGLHVSPVTPATLEFFGLDQDAGAYVSQVQKGSLAEKAGLMKGDIVTHLKGDVVKRAMAKNGNLANADNGFKVNRFGLVRVPWTKYHVSLDAVFARTKNDDQIIFVVHREGQQKECSATVQMQTPFKIKRHHLPFQKVPPYTILGGMIIMELAQNHMDLFLPAAENLLKKRVYFDSFKFLNDDYCHESKLVITYIYPETELAKNRVFSGIDRFISKVNNKSVSTIAEFEKAVLDEAASGFVTIETDRGSFVALPLEDEIIMQDPHLAEKYKYEISSLTQMLAENFLNK